LALARAERQGIRVDLSYLNRKQQQLSNRIEYLEEEFKNTDFFKDWQKSSHAKVNIGSGHQLGEYLYKVLKLKVSRTSQSGKGSTDEEALSKLGIPELDTLVRIAQLKKLRSTYIEGFLREQVNGYMHPFMNLHLVKSYRSSIDSPNLQNVPIRDEYAMQVIRGAIFPRPGHQFLEVDFKSIEVAINACINKDKNLVKYVTDPTTDMHRDMAIQLFKLNKFDPKLHKPLRQAAKNGFVFPQFYGDWFKTCAENMVCNWGKLSADEPWEKGQGISIGNSMFLADHLIGKGFTELGSIQRTGGKNTATGFIKHVKEVEEDFWGNRFSDYAVWKDRWYKEYQVQGYFDLPTGFRCQGLMDRKQVCNYPGQGAAFHCLLWSFIQADNLMRKESWDTRLVNQVHDSILFDVNPSELEHIIRSLHKITNKDLPQAWRWIIVPLSVDMELGGIDEPWSMKKPFNFKTLLI